MPHRDRVFSGPEFGGPEGLGVVVGLKYTTAPEVARRILADCLPGVPAIERTRPTSRGPIRIPDLLLAWDRDPDEVVTLARDLQREEAAHSLSDLLLGRMDGTEDPVVVETLAVRLAPRLYAVPAEAECELTGVARALAPQRPVAP